MSHRSQTPAGIVLSTRRFPRIAWTDQTGAHETIVQKRMVVGASASADLVVDDATVSRIHAELEPRDEGLWVHDLASRNGTIVNDMPVRESIVRENGEIRVGTTAITVDYSNAITAPVELWTSHEFHRMLGRSKAMRELFALIARIAPTDASILINGETGTGKEVVARSIHDASLRCKGPFVVVDCAALPENLLDAELFGHTKGAFTGAAHARAGAIESADGGTVFLDEIGELPISMQPKLLRVLEQRTVRRIGESMHRPVNVRFVTATHRDLLSMVSRGEFREDLYFRMCVLPVRVPPLRDRKEDIELLVENFLDGEHLSQEFIASLARHPWRGNVRELRNFVERARALGEHTVRQFIHTLGDDEAPTSTHVIPRTRPTMPPPSAVGGSIFGGRDLNRLPSLVDTSDETESGTTPLAMGALNTSAPFSGGSSISELRPTPSSSKPSASNPPPPVPFDGDFKIFREKWIDYGERQYLVNMLARHHRNVASLAREACVGRTYIYRLMRKHGL
jgi:transcriptional regulator with GAF, ATPase, and Fis domain